MDLFLKTYNKLTNAWLAFAQSVARPKGAPLPRIRTAQNAVNAITICVLLSLFFIKFGGALVIYADRTFGYEPTQSIPKSEWKVLYSEDCGPKCENLWRSKDSLSDTNFYEQVSKQKGKVFWVGLELDENKIKNAREANAVHLLLGRINSSFSIYVDGAERLSGNGKDILPISLPLGKNDLKNHLKISLRISHDLGSAYPVAINDPSQDAGFYRNADIGAAKDFYYFMGVLRSILLGGAALLASVLFFFLWLNVRQRNEFFVFSAFTFCLFSIQLLSWVNVGVMLPRESLYETNFQFRMLEGTLATFLGLSYARARPGAYFLVTTLAIVVFLAMERSGLLVKTFHGISLAIGQLYVPICFTLGAVACFSQSSLVRTRGFKEMSYEKLNRRCQRLNQFALFLLFLGAIYAFEVFRLGNLSGFAAYWYRPLQFTLVFLMGGFLLRDYREFDLMLERAHISRFHDPTGDQPVAVHGLLLEIDMKDSSRYYESEARLANGKELPSLWNEAAVQIASLRGGEILATEGDAFRAFFEHPADGSNILTALTEIKQMSRDFLMAPQSINFRATCVKGSILPVYKEINGKLFEDYEHAPDSTCFKDSSRFLREEKKQLFGSSKSVLVIETALLEKQTIPSKWKGLKTEKLSVPDVGDRELTFIEIL